VNSKVIFSADVFLLLVLLLTIYAEAAYPRSQFHPRGYILILNEHTVKDNGKHVEVALFGKESTSRRLRTVADRVVTINSNFLNGCWK